MNQQIQNRERASRNLKNKTYSSTLARRSPWTYWDTYIFDHSAEITRLFTVPLGGTKTKDLTNMPTYGIAQGQAFDVHGVQVQIFNGTVLTDAEMLLIESFIRRTVLEITILNKTPEYQATIMQMIGGTFHTLMNQGNTNASTGEMVSGRGSFYISSGLVKLHKKIALDEKTIFEVDLQKTVAADASLDGVELVVGLVGTLLNLV